MDVEIGIKMQNKTDRQAGFLLQTTKLNTYIETRSTHANKE